MRYSKLLLAACLVIITLGACSTGNQMKHYNDTKPELKLEEFFDGKVKGWGLVQNRSGKVVRRFDVDIDASWDGDTGTLYEEFEYYDGETQIRIWTINKNADGTYTGTAEDIIDEATGNVNGTALNWHYSMDLPVGDKTYRVKFDDWMWQMNDGVLVNRSYIKKFGFTVAELTLFMQKQKEE